MLAPPDLRDLTFSKVQALDLEIGCGVGFHPIRYVKENPTRNLIAFERTHEKFEKFSRRLKNHPHFSNLQAIHGDGVAWTAHAVSPESVERIFLLYPNPYPKNTQRGQRFYAMPDFANVVRALKLGGTITLATNMKFYIDEARASFVKDWGLKILSDRVIGAAEVPRTHFEKKYLARGETCYELVMGRV